MSEIKTKILRVVKTTKRSGKVRAILVNFPCADEFAFYRGNDRSTSGNQSWSPGVAALPIRITGWLLGTAPRAVPKPRTRHWRLIPFAKSLFRNEPRWASARSGRDGAAGKELPSLVNRAAARAFPPGTSWAGAPGRRGRLLPRRRRDSPPREGWPHAPAAKGLASVPARRPP